PATTQRRWDSSHRRRRPRALRTVKPGDLAPSHPTPLETEPPRGPQPCATGSARAKPRVHRPRNANARSPRAEPRYPRPLRLRLDRRRARRGSASLSRALSIAPWVASAARKPVRERPTPTTGPPAAQGATYAHPVSP